MRLDFSLAFQVIDVVYRVHPLRNRMMNKLESVDQDQVERFELDENEIDRIWWGAVAWPSSHDQNNEYFEARQTTAPARPAHKVFFLDLPTSTVGKANNWYVICIQITAGTHQSTCD